MNNSNGVVNRNSKTFGVTRPNKKKEQEKSQEPCSTIRQKKRNRARNVKKNEKGNLMKKGKVDGGLMMMTRKLDQKKEVTLPPPAATTFISYPSVEFVSSPFEKKSMGPGKKPKLRNRIPPPSKIPLSAVEMPPDYSSIDINVLDVSFGAFDLSDDIPQLCDPSQEQNASPPIVKYDDSIAQDIYSVITQTEYSTNSNQASVQTQRSHQVNQAPRLSIKILRRPKVSHSADYLTKQNSAVTTSQEQNALPPIVKYDDSIAQKVDSVLAQTEYSTISNQASVQTQRSFQINQAPQPSIKILRRPNFPHSADNLTKHYSAVTSPYQNINTGQPTSMYNSVYSNNPQSLSSHTSLYGTIASNIGGSSSNSHNLQLSQSNYSNLNANYPQTEAQPQFSSYPYKNPYSYQASGISYPPIVSDANVASMYSTSTNYNYMYQNINQTGNTNLSKSTDLLTSNTNSNKESLYYQFQPSNNSWTSSASNPNGNIISNTSSSIGLEQSTLLTSKTTTPTTNESGALSEMPPGVAPIVDAQYILNQQCIPGNFSPSHSVMYRGEDLQMVQSGLIHHNMTNFYLPNPMYPSALSSLTGREIVGPGILNVASNLSVTDSRCALTDNNASPNSSTLSQQMGTLAHQQILLNPPIAPSYYNGQVVVPANPFQYGTMYLMVPVASATSHGTVATNTMSGYSNTATPAGYNNVDETLGSSSVTGSSNDHGSSSKVGMSGQQATQAQGMKNLSDLASMYPSKSILNKPFQSPPPFSVTNNVGVGCHHPVFNSIQYSSYPPVLNSSIPPGNTQPHHNAPLQHQQELSSETNNMSRNQSVYPTANKVKVKQNYN